MARIKAFSPVQDGRLRGPCLGFKEVLGASLGTMGLSGTVIIGIPIIFSRSGTSTSLIFLAAMCAFLLVAAQVNVFASRVATHESLYGFVRLAFGARGGAVAGWSLLVGYAACVPAFLASIPYTLLVLFHGQDGAADPGYPTLVATAVAVAVTASWLAIRNVTISMRATLVVDVLSLSLLALAIGQYAPRPWELFSGLPSNPNEFQGSLGGLAMAMVCFTGFEAACVFGDEAKRPQITIPRANLAAVLITGVVLVIASGAVIGAYQHAPPGNGGNSFVALVAATDLRWGLPVVLGAAILSWFGCLLACLNTGARLLYTLALHGCFWRQAGRVHPRLATPFIAIIIIATIGLGSTVTLMLNGISAMEILVDTSYPAAAGFLTAYVLVSVAALVDRWKNSKGSRILVHALSSILTIAALLFTMAGLVVSF